MFRAGRRVALVGAVAAVLCGFLLQRTDTGPREVLNTDPRTTSTVLAEPAPVGVMPVAVRGRASLVDGEAFLGLGSSKPLGRGHTLAATGLPIAAALVLWRFTRPDHRVAAPRRRSCMAPLRAPPAYA